MRFLLTLLGILAGTFATYAQCNGDHHVAVYNYEIHPSELTIQVGESVSFTNYGGSHSINGETSFTGEDFDNPVPFNLSSNYAWWFFSNCLGTVTFDVPGVYHYEDGVGNNAEHQGMVGTIIVEDNDQTTVVDVIVNSSVHNLLEVAVIEADLAGTLSGEGPFTVFAPTDDAFLTLAGALNASAEDLLALPELADILLYHVVGAQVLSTDLADGATATTLLGEDVTVTINDDGIFINDAQVTVADIVTDNGVVHVIDAVLLVPEPYTVVDVIVNSDVHTLLEAAVIQADLAGTLSGEGPFTVFAPTDDAFLALAGALNASAEDLLALPELADILLYHVIGAQVLSTDLADGATATTLLGEDVEVSIECDGSIFINDAQVTVADIVTDNGVVHVIDAVLLPPTPENDCADGDCCGEGTIWDAELGQCVADDDGCPQDVDGDFFISVGDVLSILVYFGHNCN
ncbi:MAG: fasciclin domain-containing protein [Flavobacteriales bacterium]|nr:fasciclin domain-containing protein [Flavobacteriales bacterium]